MYKLVAIDLDGTLLDSNKQVPEENKETIRQVITKGIKVVVCSGRVFKGARVFARQIGTQELLVSCNGAVIKELETEEVLYANLLERQVCEQIIDLCHEEGIYFHAYINDTMYTEIGACPSSSYWKGNDELPPKDKVEIQVVESFREVIEKSKDSVTKFVIISKDSSQLARARQKAQEIKNIEVMSSCYDNFEIVNQGVSKGEALKFLSEKLGIARQEMMAIGDNENDYSMLEFVGLPVAMGNAAKSVKEISSFVTSTNDENGVSKALKKFILD